MERVLARRCWYCKFLAGMWRKSDHVGTNARWNIADSHDDNLVGLIGPDDPFDIIDRDIEFIRSEGHSTFSHIDVHCGPVLRGWDTSNGWCRLWLADCRLW